MRLFDEVLSEKIHEFIGKEGGDILKAAGIGVLYYAIRKLGGDFGPGRGVSLKFGGKNGIDLGMVNSSGSQSSAYSAVKALYSAGINAWSDASKEEYAEKIVNVLENAALVDEQTKSYAVKSLEGLANACWSGSSKEDILDHLVRVTEM